MDGEQIVQGGVLGSSMVPISSYIYRHSQDIASFPGHEDVGHKRSSESSQSGTSASHHLRLYAMAKTIQWTLPDDYGEKHFVIVIGR